MLIIGSLSHYSNKFDTCKGDRMSKEDYMEFKGKIVDTLPNAHFKVQLETGQIIAAVISGKIRKNFIKILTGDSVVVEISPYNTSIGRIIYRDGGSNRPSSEN
jgi:translation initiation factor IF-1